MWGGKHYGVILKVSDKKSLPLFTLKNRLCVLCKEKEMVEDVENGIVDGEAWVDINVQR